MRLTWVFRILFFLILGEVFLFSTSLYAEEHQIKKFQVSGKILNEEDGQPLEIATIVISNTLWATTDAEGNFMIRQVPAGKYTYEVSYLGFQKKTGTIVVDRVIDTLLIRMVPLSLGLDEIVVTAQEQKLGSSSAISQSAIQHIQPKSIEDLLQLLPGNLTRNPDLSTVGQVALREISGDDNNALGTAVILDGAPMTNDANLQAYSTAKSGSNSSNKMNGMSEQTTSGRGIDLRTLSPDNIESVEVIRGIPSVESGNLTSGALVVKTKSGATPLEAKAKVDPNSKMFYVGKGFHLGGNRGAMNLAVDYTQSYADIRKRYEGFDRITGDIGYSNTFLKQSRPLSFNFRMMYFRNVNNVKSDPQMVTDERIKNNNQGIRLSIDGNWRLNSSWISNLTYSLSVQYTHQEDYSKQQVVQSSGVSPYASSYVSGEFAVPYLNSSYYSEFTIDGKPLDIFGQLKTTRQFQFSGDHYTALKVGLEWRYNVNRGEGLVYDPEFPPSNSGNQTIRPRSFKSVPAMKSFSYFLEDKTMVGLASTLLTFQAGVRFSHLFVDEELAQRKNIFTLEPRINFNYRFLNTDNNRWIDELSLTGGFGIASKTPTLLHLYPNKTYFDHIAFNYYDTENPANSLAVMQTTVVENTSNPDLKPALSRKFEVGLTGRVNKVRGNVTFFYEKHKNEFSFMGMPSIVPYRKYSVPVGGQRPFYQDGQVSYYDAGGQIQQAAVTMDTAMSTYSIPVNSYRTEKKGIEYSLNLGRINPIRTEIIVDGAWFHIKRRTTQPYYSSVSGSYAGKPYPYLALMPGGSGTVENRFNTTFRFVTHIPQLKMIFSTTAQVVWYQSSRRIYEDDQGRQVFYRDQILNGGKEEWKYFVDPVGFLDKSGQLHEWLPEYREQGKYNMMMSSFSHEKYFDKEVYAPNCFLNFRLTKEFGKMLDLSFTANNFLKITQLHRNKTTGGYKDMLIPLYFGAELKLKIN